jgi:Leucine-rich repeat (LRR) protein
VQELPDISSFKTLKRLYLCDNYIKELPSYLGNALSLEFLDVSKTEINCLPETLFGLHEIKYATERSTNPLFLNNPEQRIDKLFLNHPNGPYYGVLELLRAAKTHGNSGLVDCLLSQIPSGAIRTYLTDAVDISATDAVKFNLFEDLINFNKWLCIELHTVHAMVVPTGGEHFIEDNSYAPGAVFGFDPNNFMHQIKLAYPSISTFLMKHNSENIMRSILNEICSGNSAAKMTLIKLFYELPHYVIDPFYKIYLQMTDEQKEQMDSVFQFICSEATINNVLL